MSQETLDFKSINCTLMWFAFNSIIVFVNILVIIVSTLHGLAKF